MAKEIKKTIRITDEIAIFVSVLAKSLNISENDAYKIMLFEYIRKTPRELFYIKRG